MEKKYYPPPSFSSRAPHDEIIGQENGSGSLSCRSACWCKEQKREEQIVIWDKAMEGQDLPQSGTISTVRLLPLPESGGQVLTGQP